MLSSDLLLIVGTSLQGTGRVYERRNEDRNKQTNKRTNKQTNSRDETVYSAYRFARYAAGHGINGHGGFNPKGAKVSVGGAGGAKGGARSSNERGPVEIAIFNMGETRADDLATYRASMLATDCMGALSELAR